MNALRPLKLTLMQYKYFFFLGFNGAFFYTYSMDNMNKFIPDVFSFMSKVGIYHGHDTPIAVYDEYSHMQRKDKSE